MSIHSLYSILFSSSIFFLSYSLFICITFLSTFSLFIYLYISFLSISIYFILAQTFIKTLFKFLKINLVVKVTDNDYCSHLDTWEDSLLISYNFLEVQIIIISLFSLINQTYFLKYYKIVSKFFFIFKQILLQWMCIKKILYRVFYINYEKIKERK